MVEALKQGGAPQTLETSGKYKDVYAGLVRATDNRLQKMPRHMARNVAHVHFDLTEEDLSLSGLMVYRSKQEGVLPVTFEEPTFKETVGLRRDGRTVMPPESTMLTEFAQDLVRRLEILDGAPATATVVTNYDL